MAKIYERHFENNGIIVHIPAGFFYEIKKDDKGALFRYSAKTFDGANDDPSKGEAYERITGNLWVMLMQKPKGKPNIVTLVLEDQ